MNPIVVMIVLIAVVALLLWLIPVDEFLKKLIYAILVIGVIVCLLSILGVWSPPFFHHALKNSSTPISLAAMNLR